MGEKSICESLGFATAVVTGSSLGTLVGTGCVAVRNVVGEAVTECRAYVRLGVGNVTARTLRGLSTVSKTGFILVGLIVIEVMTESVKSNVLTAKLCLTYGAVNYVVLTTGSGTIGSAVVFNYGIFGVTESVKGNVLTTKLCFTYGAVNYVILTTGSYTIGSNVVFYNLIHLVMTECVKSNSLAGNLCGTNGAV